MNVEDGGILVDSVPLDVVARGHEIDRVDLVKMNIEGAESDALLGATDLLGRTSHAAISCHDFIGDNRDDDSFRTLESVERILTTAGFAIARRTSDPRPWIRDTLYASRKQRDSRWTRLRPSTIGLARSTPDGGARGTTLLRGKARSCYWSA